MAEPISQGGILKFWTPLAMTWAIMGVEIPIVALVVARMPDATANLAALGAAVSVAWLSETFVVNMAACSLRLAQDRASYRQIRLYAFVLAAASLAINVALVATPALTLILAGPIGMTDDLAALTAEAYVWLTFWPALIGLRRFYQGQVIRHGQTRRIAYGTFIRLAMLCGSAVLFSSLGGVSGAAVGAIALLSGIAAEFVAARLMAGQAIRRTLAAEVDEPPPSFGEFWRFYWPLTVMMALNLAVGAMATAGLAKSKDAVEALAAFPVAHSVNFVMRAIMMSYQETSIALLGYGERNLKPLSRFAIGLGATATAILAFMAFTPLAAWIFEVVMELPAELQGRAQAAFLMLLPYPALTLWYVWSRARLTHRRQTRPIATATVVETLGLALLLWGLTTPAAMDGAAAAGLAMTLSRLIGNAWLERAVRAEFRA